MVFNGVQKAFEFMNTNGYLAEGISTEVQDVINTNNVARARELASEFQLQLA